MRQLCASGQASEVALKLVRATSCLLKLNSQWDGGLMQCLECVGVCWSGPGVCTNSSAYRGLLL